MDGILSYLEKVLEAKNIFERQRKKTSSRALGILLYHFGVSLRNCHEVVSSFELVSHESVRLWYHKAEGLFSVEKAFRRVIAIDETKVKINGKWHILWAAIDVDTWEVLGVWITQGRASLRRMVSLDMFLQNVRTILRFLWMVALGINLR